MLTTCRIVGRALCWCVVAGVLAGLSGCQVPNSALRQQGLEHFQLGRLDQAEAPFAQAVDQDPADWKSAYYLGRIRLHQDRNDDAVLLLERSYNLRPDHAETPDILDALAEALYRTDRTSRLLALLRQRSQQEGTTRAYLREAEYLWRTGDPDAARSAYRLAARFARPDDPTPYLAQADFYEAVGDREAAVTALRQAYTINPRSRRVANRLREYQIVPGPTIALPPDRTQVLDPR